MQAWEVPGEVGDVAGIVGVVVGTGSLGVASGVVVVGIVRFVD